MWPRRLDEDERPAYEVGVDAAGRGHGQIGNQDARDARHASPSGARLSEDERLSRPPDPVPRDDDAGVEAVEHGEPFRPAAPARAPARHLEADGRERAGLPSRRGDQQDRAAPLGGTRQPRPDRGRAPPAAVPGVEHHETEAARAEQDVGGARRERRVAAPRGAARAPRRRRRPPRARARRPRRSRRWSRRPAWHAPRRRTRAPSGRCSAGPRARRRVRGAGRHRASGRDRKAPSPAGGSAPAAPSPGGRPPAGRAGRAGRRPRTCA